MFATHGIVPGDQTAALDIAARLAMRAPSARRLLVGGRSAHRTPAPTLPGTMADGVIDAANGPVAVVKEAQR
jgi:hypothetical protein